MNLIETIVAGLVLISPSFAEPVDSSLLKTERSAECIALNMYHEARNQGSAGILAVTAVVFNRVKDKRFPNTVCEVIKQGPTRESWKTKQTPEDDAVYYPVKNKCQFSWYCDGKGDKPKDIKTYKKNKNFVIVSSGAIALGQKYLRIKKRKLKSNLWGPLKI